MALCLLCELDATICVIQNISIIYVMCAYICCIYSKPVAYVSNSVLKMTLKNARSRTKSGPPLGQLPGADESRPFRCPPAAVWNAVARWRWPKYHFCYLEN
jgi:hypothetical protein